MMKTASMIVRDGALALQLSLKAGTVAGGVAGSVVAAPEYAAIDGQKAAVPAIVMGDPAVSISDTPS